MATNTEKIDELFRIAHTLTERVDALREEVKGISPDLGKITDALSQVATRLALSNSNSSNSKVGKIRSESRKSSRR